MNLEDIVEINRLILQYRGQLTTNEINDNGGFKIKDTLPKDEVGFFEVKYNNKKIHVMHVYGNVYGFIRTGGNGNEELIYIGNIHEDLKSVSSKADAIAAKFFIKIICLKLTDNLVLDNIQGTREIIIKQEYRDKLQKLGLVKQQERKLNFDNINGINTKEEIEGVIFLSSSKYRYYEELPTTEIFKNIDGINKHLNSLFLGNDSENIKYQFMAFLTVCSECAKNSLLQQLLITNLIYSCYGASERLSTEALRNIFMNAAKNCGNGEISYLYNNSQDLLQIMDKCSMKLWLDRAEKYGKDKEYSDSKGLYESLISSQYYKDCQTLLDLTDENINDKIDSSFVSRVIKYLTQRDAQIVNLMKLNKTDIILRMLEVAKNASEGDEIIKNVISLSGAVISNDLFKCLVKSYHNKCCNNKEICDKLHKMLALSRYEEQGFLNENEKNTLKEFYTDLKSDIEAQLQNLDGLYKSKKELELYEKCKDKDIYDTLERLSKEQSVSCHSLLRILAKRGDCEGCMKFIENNDGCDEIKAKRFYLALSKLYAIERLNNLEMLNSSVFKEYKQILHNGDIPNIQAIKEVDSLFESRKTGFIQEKQLVFETWVKFARLAINDPGKEVSELLRQIRDKQYDALYNLSVFKFNSEK